MDFLLSVDFSAGAPYPYRSSEFRTAAYSAALRARFGRTYLSRARSAAE